MTGRVHPRVADMRYLIATRQTFGLDSSRAHILDVARDPGAMTIDIGVPISAAEHAEMERRNGLGRYIGRIEAAGHGSPRYGGVALDQAAGGVIVIKIVRYDPADPADRAYAQRLAAMVPTTTQAVIRSVPYSVATLLRVVQRVTRAFAAGELDRYSANSATGSDQKVTIGIDPSAPPDAETSLHHLFPWPYLTVIRVEPVALEPGHGRMPTKDR